MTRWLELGGQSVYASEIKGGSLLAANGGIAYPARRTRRSCPRTGGSTSSPKSRINTFTSLKLYAQNLTDKTYYDSLYQSAQPFIKVAPGRAIHLSLAFNFNKL